MQQRAIMLCLVSAALGLYSAIPLPQERIEPALEHEPVAEPRQDAGAEQGKAEPAQQPTESDRLLPAVNAIERAIRELKTADDTVERERQEKREIADIKAQQRMAFWATWMFWATFAAVLVTAAGVYLIWQTLGHTRRAADAAVKTLKEAEKHTVAAFKTIETAVDANKINRDAMIAAHRAWLFPDNTQIVAPLEWTGHAGRIGVKMVFKNAGQTPAFGVFASSKIWIGFNARARQAYDSFAHEERRGSPFIGLTVLRGARYSPTFHIDINAVDVEQWLKLFGNDRAHVMLNVLGCVTYSLLPSLDGERHQTGFVFEIYQPVIGYHSGTSEIINPSAGNVPAERLQLKRGHLADVFMD